MDDLTALATTLRGQGISLVVDLVLNHVAREHGVGRPGRAGEQKYRDYFHIFADRTEPDAYERTAGDLPRLRPGQFHLGRRGAGLGLDDLQLLPMGSPTGPTRTSSPSSPTCCCSWPTTVSRCSDSTAVAFTWKVLGTDCQNEPQVHELTQALRAVLRIVAPACALKAGAIVGPRRT